ncbi:MAG: hypothetical protein R3C03_24265 [Pirellulaceae bacterium]
MKSNSNRCQCMLYFFVLQIAIFSPTSLGQLNHSGNEILLKAPSDDCLFYSAWDYTTNPNSSSSNSQDRLLAEPDVQRFIGDVLNLTKTIPGELQINDDDTESPVSPTVINWFIDTWVLSPGCIFVDRLSFPKQGVPINADFVLLARLADKFNSSQETINDLFVRFNAQLVNCEIGGLTFRKYLIANPDMPWELFVGGFEGNLIIGSNEQSIQRMLERINGDAIPAWVNDLKNSNQQIERVTTIGKLDYERIEKIAMEGTKRQDTRVYKALGFDKIQSIESVSGYTKTEMNTRVTVRFESEPDGIFDLFAKGAVDIAALKQIPSDASIAGAFVLDGIELNHFLQQTMSQIDVTISAAIGAGLLQLNQMTGVDMEAFVLENIGPTWSFYNPAGSSDNSWALRAAVGKKDDLQVAVEALVDLFNRTFENMLAPGMEIEKIELPSGPHYTLTNEELGQWRWTVKDQFLELVLSNVMQMRYKQKKRMLRIIS